MSTMPPPAHAQNAPSPPLLEPVPGAAVPPLQSPYFTPPMMAQLLRVRKRFRQRVRVRRVAQQTQRKHSANASPAQQMRACAAAAPKAKRGDAPLGIVLRSRATGRKQQREAGGEREQQRGANHGDDAGRRGELCSACCPRTRFLDRNEGGGHTAHPPALPRARTAKRRPPRLAQHALPAMSRLGLLALLLLGVATCGVQARSLMDAQKAPDDFLRSNGNGNAYLVVCVPVARHRPRCLRGGWAAASQRACCRC